MKAWATKYALTNGIEQVEGTIPSDFPKMLVVVKNGWTSHFHKPHWHTSEDDAVKQALKMKARKIQALQAQIKRIESLEFKLKETT